MMPYVYTNAKKDAVLNEGDELYILGNSGLEVTNPDHSPFITITVNTIKRHTRQSTLLFLVEALLEQHML